MSIPDVLLIIVSASIVTTIGGTLIHLERGARRMRP